MKLKKKNPNKNYRRSTTRILFLWPFFDAYVVVLSTLDILFEERTRLNQDSKMKKLEEFLCQSCLVN